MKTLASSRMLPRLLFLAAAVSAASSSSQGGINFTSQYWTAFLNISYVDSGRQVWHTERSETGRFGSNGVKEATGVAVEIISSVQNPKLRSPHNLNGHAAADAPGYSEDGLDRSGCTPPFRRNYPVPGEGEEGEAWIAVIRRGGCTFNEKIRNVLALNASGVLIYDNEDGGVLQSMKVEKFSIPSVFTYHWKGAEIVDLIKRHGPRKVRIALQEGSHCRTTSQSKNGESDGHRILYCTPLDAAYADDLATMLRKAAQEAAEKRNGGGGGFSAAPFWNLNLTNSVGGDAFKFEKRTSVLFVSISFVILMVISLAWLVFYYVQRFRYIHAKDRLERRLCSQAKRALAIISTSVLKTDDLDLHESTSTDGATCAVCIENYRVDEVVRILPCKHRFHKSCIDQWLLEKRTCPMCKMDILKHYGMLVEEVDEEDHDSSARRQRRRIRQQQRNRRSELDREERVERRPEVEGDDREDAAVSLA